MAARKSAKKKAARRKNIGVAKKKAARRKAIARRMNERLRKHSEEGIEAKPPGAAAISGFKNPLQRSVGRWDFELGRNPGDVGMTMSTQFKKGGIVRGVGKAHRGFGKAMKGKS